jgi:hypothetical protein
MVDPRYITITVAYDRAPRYGRSLEWIAPELKGSALTMTEDQLDEPAPSRTWAGLVDGSTYEQFAQVDGSTYEQFAQAWRLKEAGETMSRTVGDHPDQASHTYVLDGMNWESGGESPIICVSVEVTRQG